ncbi:MAG: UvrD-helicase domain-containing protein, partial [Deltaproteobacteria bacterium]|nr:UvrD-helicase domain-containing protein [Deltaproteobacteria bacterium]
MSPEISDPLQAGVPLHGFHLIEASAGTGKTHKITDLFLRLLLREHWDAGKILAVTFTDAATNELKSKIRERLRAALNHLDGKTETSLEAVFSTLSETERAEACPRLEAALATFDDAAIFTIHSFCLKILSEYPLETGTPFQMELMPDSSLLLRQTAADFWRREADAASPELLRHLLRNYAEKGAFNGKDAPNDFPAHLVRFGQVLLNRHFPLLLPQEKAGNAESFARKKASLHEAFETLRACWPTTRPELAAIFSSGVLNKRSYGEEQCVRSLREMDTWLAKCNPLQPFANLEKFCASLLHEKTLKGKTLVLPPFCESCEQLLTLAQEAQKDLENAALALHRRFAGQLARELRRRGDQLHFYTYHDLLTRLDEALVRNGEKLAALVRERFPVALIDEFQDTDPVQWQIFQNIYLSPAAQNNRSLLFVIGDPKQAIYSFRGGDIFTYMKAARKARSRFTLDTNWRSVAPLVEGINHLFSQKENPFLFKEIRFERIKAAANGPAEYLESDGHPVKQALTLWLDRTKNGDAAMATAIRRLLEKARLRQADGSATRLSPQDIAVITRTNKKAMDIQSLLGQRGIAAVVHSSTSIFDTVEARDLLRLLKGLLEPARMRQILTLPLFGLNWEKCYELLNDMAQKERWMRRFGIWREIWQTQGIAVMAANLMTQMAVRPRILALPCGERQLTNILHCWEILHQAERIHHLDANGLASWFARQIEQIPEKEEYQLRLETDDLAVQIFTIHKSKGLQFPVVFVPDLGDSDKKSESFPFFHDQEEKPVLWLGGKEKNEYESHIHREKTAENMRLLYVALTRARYLCITSWNGKSGPLETLLSENAPGEETGEQPQKTKNKKAKNETPPCGDEENDEQLETLRRRLAPDIAVELLPEADNLPWAREDPGTVQLSTPPTLPEAITPAWQNSSFTALTAQLPSPVPNPSEEMSEESFPRGKRAGDCLHRIFEQANCSAVSQEKLVRNILRHYRFDEELWLEPV